MPYSYLKRLSCGRENLVKALQLVQKHEGYVSNEAIEAVARHCGDAAVEVEGVTSFYPQLRRSKPGKFTISICDGSACHIKGSNLIARWLYDELGITSGQTTSDGLFSLTTVACLGCCSLAPVIAVNQDIHGYLNRKKLLSVLQIYRKLAEISS